MLDSFLNIKTNQESLEYFPEEINEKFFTVSEITREIRTSLEHKLSNVCVIGEISNVRKPGSGHVYLTLKDKNAQLQAVVFRNTASRTKFELKDGIEVVSFGSITVYEPRGQYQLIINKIEPKGIGALQLAFQQLKEKLEKEGLFDHAHKKTIPFIPQKIGIVTSPTGAAIKDILNIIERRFANVEILIYPVRVQGEGAAQEIAEAISELNKLSDIDVIISGRGGGSLEDLWAFNEEIVARSIYNSRIPIISAVGHEIDVTIADLVADKRALTPSEAGELVVPRKDLLVEKIEKFKARLLQSLTGKLRLSKEKLVRIANSYAMRQPFDRLNRWQQKLDEFTQRLNLNITHALYAEREKLSGIAGKLESLSPLNVLKRGYTITTRLEDNKSLRDIKNLSKGGKIKTNLSKGSVISEILSIEKR
ncbi:MAG: exodeoxyribonuclease VII large subunit [Candidatus Scalindua sp.]|jgi:exodeoxyribonuclease VII large subunit|nr:exodeoxyribonuclease VII large subunit [Candidatus Scalindua sp.]MBT5303463.1 exodeoxyribonuclease VII large subunit [Candidatus Scalindua sp.]MBT6046923.1 exodeoxyribonuclease VII large subunit [Candidatus Scalindua sp.]MBT6227410.1 exodeoxyribonuclease VII large subunit [Candidatus Scalindua sp.]MBT6561241.1 exodeoxyribonuclease VII large subunit [Candidatus Scalindua sp.]